jgi:hypothetical protein
LRGRLPLELGAQQLKEADEGVLRYLRALPLQLYDLLRLLQLVEEVEDLDEGQVLVDRGRYRFALVNLVEEVAQVEAVGQLIELEEVLVLAQHLDDAHINQLISTDHLKYSLQADYL